MKQTRHYKNDNFKRKELINNVIGVGYPIKDFYWDKGHKNGAEVHTITNTGIIVIKNFRTQKMVTMLIARPQQIKRYYNSIGEKAPEGLISIAIKHQKLGYNEY